MQCRWAGGAHWGEGRTSKEFADEGCIGSARSANLAAFKRQLWCSHRPQSCPQWLGVSQLHFYDGESSFV